MHYCPSIHHPQRFHWDEVPIQIPPTTTVYFFPSLLRWLPKYNSWMNSLCASSLDFRFNINYSINRHHFSRAETNLPPYSVADMAALVSPLRAWNITRNSLISDMNNIPFSSPLTPISSTLQSKLSLALFNYWIFLMSLPLSLSDSSRILCDLLVLALSAPNTKFSPSTAAHW